MKNKIEVEHIFISLTLKQNKNKNKHNEPESNQMNDWSVEERDEGEEENHQTLLLSFSLQKKETRQRAWKRETTIISGDMISGCAHGRQRRRRQRRFALFTFYKRFFESIYIIYVWEWNWNEWIKRKCFACLCIISFHFISLNKTRGG